MFFKKHQLLQEYFSVSIVINLLFFNLLAKEKRTVRKKQHIFSMNTVHTNTNPHMHKHVHIPIPILTLIWTFDVWRLTMYDAWPTIYDIYTYTCARCMRSDVWGRTVWHMTYRYTYKCTYTYTCPCAHKHMYMYIYTCTFGYGHIHTDTYLCMQSKYTHIHTHIHVSIHINWHIHIRGPCLPF